MGPARVAWLSDIHLNFLAPPDRARVIGEWAGLDVDTFVITGDISEADDLVARLRDLAAGLRRPLHYVLGNHDFYRGAIADVRAAISKLGNEVPELSWLGDREVMPLTPSTALVGHDGWADARLGDYDATTLQLTDFQLIHDFVGLSRAERRRRLEELADEAASHVSQRLHDALKHFPHVVVATHVPPFAASCSTEGRIWNADWLPYFVSHAMGQAIGAAAENHPDHRITVLCGHTHRAANAMVRDNLLALTAPAEYRDPRVERVFDWD